MRNVNGCCGTNGSGFTDKQAETLAEEHVALLNANLATKVDIEALRQDVIEDVFCAIEEDTAWHAEDWDLASGGAHPGEYQPVDRPVGSRVARWSPPSSRNHRYVFDRYTPAPRPYCGRGENTPFPWHEGVAGARTAHLDADKARQAVNCGRCEKNTGSAVEMEPHGGTLARGAKRRAISTG